MINLPSSSLMTIFMRAISTTFATPVEGSPPDHDPVFETDGMVQNNQGSREDILDNLF